MSCDRLHVNQSNVFIKSFLHQQMSHSTIQKLSLKSQTASNADVEKRWLGKIPLKGRNLEINLERDQALSGASSLLTVPGGDYNRK